MKSVARAGDFHGVAAIYLENEVLRAAILPARGSKIASLFHKPTNVELLWQPPDGCYPAAQYGDPYDARHATGFDEMFPSIAAGRYERVPWAGTEIPDHGEVWSIPWTASIAPDKIRMEVNGVRFPYRLRKRVRLDGKALEIFYEAANLSPFDLDFLWAAHPLFNAAPGMKIVVPPGMNSVINSAPGTRLPEYGRVYAFPRCRLAGGEPLNLDHIPERNATGYQKYYFQTPATEGWCELHHPSNGLVVRLKFPIEQVPYLGMWVNEGGWNGQYNVAPEPCTGAMDDIDAAKKWGMNSVLAALQSRTWWLRVSVYELSALT